jgi:hypothetical protein
LVRQRMADEPSRQRSNVLKHRAVSSQMTR